MGQYLIQLALTIPALLICMTIHEMSHGYAAYALGDHTAKNMGRLSPNPLKHIDPIGFLLLIIVHFGWAKPVPVNMYNFKDPKKGMALTALAGPAANILLAFIAVFIRLLSLQYFHLQLGGYVDLFLQLLIQYNVVLAMFNFIPISPLDGSKILFAFLPNKWYYRLMQYEQYGMILMVILLATNIITPILSTGVYNLTMLIYRLLLMLPIW
jgi:Zn-dependent protease